MFSKINNKEKDNKIIYVLVIIIAILLSVIAYYLFFNKCKNDCSKCEINKLEEKNYQLISYSGLTFKMPLDWSFINENYEYAITDADSGIFISMETILEPYDVYITSDYQNTFLETIQTSNDIKIDKSKQEDYYYMYEGNYNDYNCLVIALESNNKVILVKTQFIDKSTYNKQKDSVIDFCLSGIKKNED